MHEKFFQVKESPEPHRIAYAEWGKASAHAPVVCVHGLTRNSRDFDELAKTLQTETRVFCVDIAGRGHSDWFKDPAHYNYAQYMADMTAFIAQCGAPVIDWVGTSMGGIIGMLLAAQENAPIRRLVVNDVGPFIPLAALKRIATYVGSPSEFADKKGVEKYFREIYASFGSLSDENWRHLAEHGTRALPNDKLSLAYDPAIAEAFFAVDKDVDFWDAYDRIQCPILLLRGMKSDVLPADVAKEMTRRGPKAQLIEFPRIGHAPALMDPTQIALIAEFLHS
jgi:pimeloyl-ACP methyl ester carboxylesterase